LWFNRPLDGALVLQILAFATFKRKLEPGALQHLRKTRLLAAKINGTALYRRLPFIEFDLTRLIISRNPDE
jgi:hypothetical protein